MNLVRETTLGGIEGGESVSIYIGRLCCFFSLKLCYIEHF